VKVNFFVQGWICFILLFTGCNPSKKNTVVVYTALDRNFSEPIFQEFTRKTGIQVLPKYDTESTKTVGLVNAIIAEATNPRCDVFWNNEIVNTIRLQKRNLLRTCDPANATLYPENFRDSNHQWFGFAARARVLIVNTNRVNEANMPASIMDLVNPVFRNNAAIAKPLFGTTASHVACLFSKLSPDKTKNLLRAYKANGIIVEAGNKTCALNVSAGKRAVALTDTDDAMIELQQDKPVKIIFPDIAPGQMGTLLIPNTVSILTNCPHPKAAERLINYLLSPEVEERLAHGASAQIPLNKTYRGKHPLGALPEQWMKVDFKAAADQFENAAKWIREEFLLP